MTDAPATVSCIPGNPRRVAFELAGSGQTIAALEWGVGDRLAVLHHANGFCAALWAPVAEKLAERYRVIALDARGHGDSSKPRDVSSYRWECFAEDLVGVCEQALAPAAESSVEIVVGHSFGGSAAIVAAARRRALFGRLVLVDPVVPPPALLAPSVDKTEAGRLLAAGARRRKRIWRSREEARRSWEGHAFFSTWDPEVLTLYVEEGLIEHPDGRVELKCPPEVEAMIFEAGAMLDPYPFAEQVAAPVMVVHAAKGSFPIEFHRALSDSLPRGRLEVVPAGHLVVMEQPGLVARAVMGFSR